MNRKCGFDLVGHSTLPDEAWWDDFHGPTKKRIAELHARYAGDAEASALLDQFAAKAEMHRRQLDFYAYEFSVARRPLGLSHLGMTAEQQHAAVGAARRG